MLAGTTEADRMARTRNRCNTAGYESVALVPLRVGKETFGLLQFNDKHKGRFTPEKISLLERLADNLAIGLAQRRAEKALRESQQSLVRAQQMAHIGDWDRDFVQNTVKWSEELYRIFGVSPDDFEPTYKGFLNLVHPDDRELVGKITTNATSGKQPLSVDYRIVRPDGSECAVHSQGEIHTDDNGQVIRICGTVQDITERKKSERELKESEERYKALFKCAPDGIIVADVETGQYIHVNPFICKRLGYSEEEIKGLSQFSGIHPKGEMDRIKRLFFMQARGEIDIAEDIPFVKKDGTICYFDVNSVCVEINGIQRVIGLLRDITERKKAEKTLITYQNDLRSLASKLTSTEEFQRRQIAADLHDNVSQTLALSVNQLRRLRKSAASGEAKILDEICQMTEKVIQNVQDLTFDLASPTLYKIGLEAAISELLSEQLRDRHGIACKFSDDKKDKPLDDNIRVLLFQAVRELLVNVIKHAKAHEVEVAIQRENDKIQISVSDDGVGFDIQEAETSIERSGGFGLFNIRERIDYIDGSFEIHSQPGSGSRFILTAPIKTKTDLSPERYDGN
jgi:PAS domain S-box-containing protein